MKEETEIDIFRRRLAEHMALQKQGKDAPGWKEVAPGVHRFRRKDTFKTIMDPRLKKKKKI